MLTRSDEKMKINKGLLIFLMVFVSLLAVGAASAADSDDIADDAQLSVADEEIQTIEIDENEALSAEDDVKVDVDVKDTPYDEQVYINVSVVDNTGTVNFNESAVEILVDDDYIGEVPISGEGKAGCDLALGVLDVGSHYVKTTLLNGTARIASAGTTFSVTKANPIVIVENVTAGIGQGVKVTVNVTDSQASKVSGDAIVTIFMDGNSISKYARIVNGTAESSFDMADMMGGMMNMDWGSMFGGNNTNGSGAKMEFNMSDFRNMMNGTSGGNGPFGGMGSSAVKYNYFLPVGSYKISAVFIGNRNYNSAENNSNLTVVYPNDVVFATDISTPDKIGDKTIVSIIAFDKYGNFMHNITVTASVDSSQQTNVTLDEYAMGTVTFENLVNGAHKLLISTNATGNMTNQTVDFTVALPRINVTIEANDMSVVAVNTAVDGKTGKYFTAILKDSLGNVLANKSVELSIDSTKYDLTTNADGAVEVQLNIAKANTYTCAVAFLGDEAYNGKFEIAKVTVTKQTAKLTTKKASYKAKAKTKKLTATFKSAKGKAIKGKKITFTVKGKTYTAKTNAKGVATVNVKLTKKGTYTFTAKFAGDDTYKAISKKAKLTIK